MRRALAARPAWVERLRPWLPFVVLAAVLLAAMAASVVVGAPPHAIGLTPRQQSVATPVTTDELLADIPVGTVSEHVMQSSVLQRAMPFLVYVPPSPDPTTTFPVLYLLHGLSADYHQWFRLGVVAVADSLIAQRRIPPMVIVLPQGDDGYWMNHQPAGPRYADYLLREVIPHVESVAPIDGRREMRAIGGISAGGHGALQTAWNNPRLFSVVGAHSPGLRTQQEAFAFFGLGDEFARRDPMTLARRISRADMDIWIDSGSHDPWRARAEGLSLALTERGIPNIWRTWTGGHDGAYWSAHLKDYLLFYGQAIARRQALIALNDPSRQPIVPMVVPAP